MIDSSAGIELFGSASPVIIEGLHAGDVASTFKNYLGMFYRGKRYPDALSGLLQEVEEGNISNPALRFVEQYQSLFREFETYLRTDKESIVAKAIFNQRLAQGIAVAQTDSDIGEKAMKFIEIVRAMGFTGIELGRACNNALNGARTHAGLMSEFDRHGYQILMPNTDDPREVSIWDVAGGTDFVAVKMEGRKVRSVVLVDAKSDAGSSGSDSNNYRIEIHSKNDRRSGLWHAIARSALDHLDMEISDMEIPDDIVLRHMNITLHGHTMDDLGGIIDSRVGNQLMNAVGKNF